MTPRVATKTSNGFSSELRSWLWGAMPNTNVSDPSIGVRVGHAVKQPIHEQRDLSRLTSAAGGFTVPTDFSSRLYEHIVESSGVRQTGAVVYTTDGGEPLLVPKTTGQSTATLVAEAGTINESDPAFGQASLGAFKYALLIQVSQELEQDSEIDLFAYLARQAGRAIGLASGAHYVNGTGTGQPEGCLTNATVGAQAPTGNTTALHIDTLVSVYASVASEYAERGVWLMHPQTRLRLLLLREGASLQFIYQPGLAGAPDTLLGRPIVTDVAMPQLAANAKGVLFGDFSSGYAIRDVAEVRFERSEGFAFGTGLVTLRAALRTDGRPIDALALRAYQASAT